VAKHSLQTLLSSALTNCVKQYLHERVRPPVKSSHLMEAVARGLGFSTAAALQSANKSTSRQIVCVDFDAMSQRLVELGYAPLNRSEIEPERLMSMLRQRFFSLEDPPEYRTDLARGNRIL
jgi:hypothetical protein